MRPAFQFYPGDWQRDAALQSCSIGARGLWIEMLCIMHQSDPYGHLKINGKVVEISTLSRLVGASQRETKVYINELENAGVFQRDPDRAIYSKRMVNDEKTRQARAAGGKKGGNPRLTSKDNLEVGSKVNLHANLPPTPSSSSSSSSSPYPLHSEGEMGATNKKPKSLLDQIRVGQNLDNPDGRKALETFALLQVTKGNFNPIAFQGIVEKLADYPARKAIGFLRSWLTDGRFMPNWKADWEVHAPSDAKKQSPKFELDRSPR